MVGSHTNPGNYSDIHQTDIVPTISTLLRIAPPGAAQGRILFEMLRLDEYDRTVAQLLLANQRAALAEAYVSQIQGESVVLPDTLAEELTQAQASLNSNNIGGAFELASLAQQEADTQMAIARNGRIRREQLPQLVITALIVFIWLVTMWRRRGLHAGSVLVATIATVVLYHALYWLQGYSYSISALSGLSEYTELPFEVARRVAVSLLAGGGLLLISFMLTDEIDWTTLLGTGYGFSVLATFIFILPFFWGSWQNGLVATWRLPEVDPAYWQISSAFEATSAAVLGLILPWPIMSLSLFINLIRRRLSETRAGTAERGTLPGLRF
jgi:hypothetical protein